MAQNFIGTVEAQTSFIQESNQQDKKAKGTPRYVRH
jgi:hypothetical protein